MAPLLWTQRQDIGPSARLSHRLAYDEARKRTVLFGGWSGLQVDPAEAWFGDTWLWDGEAWTQAEDTGPQQRFNHATAYDAARSRIVLFGGRFDLTEFGDTWLWDGEAWTQAEDTGPSPRQLHAVAFDSMRARLVLFGGISETGTQGDTWEWDGEAWTQVADTGPSPRYGHAMCFDRNAGRTILFGGSEQLDTWTWDGERWTEVTDLGPPPCIYTALVATSRGSILFGGNKYESSSILDALVESTWELVEDDWTERQNMGPTGRWGHALAYDTARERVVLFGGNGWQKPDHSGGIAALGDTWELPVGT
jgi:Galactose oxidase, central domain